MDEAVIKYYRRLLKEEFPNSGPLANPTIFIEAVGEKLINCGNTGNYMQLFIQIEEDCIKAITYLCSCEPVANVAVEVLCNLMRGKRLAEAERLGEEPFYDFLGSRDEPYSKKVVGVLELFKEGITSYYAQGDHQETPFRSDKTPGSKLSWDAALSTGPS